MSEDLLKRARLPGKSLLPRVSKKSNTVRIIFQTYIKLDIKQLMAGGGVALIGTTLVPLRIVLGSLYKISHYGGYIEKKSLNKQMQY